MKPVFAYLFERFPSFTQTFCAREIQQWERLGFSFPIYSIHSTDAEEVRHFPETLYARTITLPPLTRAARQWWRPFYYRARQVKRAIYSRWGVEGGRQRAAEVAWLAPRLQRAGVKHLHVHFAGLATRTAYWLHRLYGITFSFTAHANDFFVEAPGLFLDDLFEEARFVITVSDFSREALRERFPSAAQRIHRVYNGIQVADFAPPDTCAIEPPCRPRIVSVGRYIEKKGYPDLISACALLGDLDFECLLVGQGPLEQDLRRQIASLGLDGKVQVTGPRSEKEIRSLLHESTVFALACCREADGGMDNLPTVIMEAMAAAVPVVSTRLAGVPEMIVEGRTGLVVPEHGVVELAEALRAMLSQPEKAREMGRAGQALARERFDLSVTSAHLRDSFDAAGVL